MNALLSTAMVFNSVLAASVGGAVVSFDNSSAAFVWTGNGTLGIAGSLFDPTRAPTDQQSVSFTPRQLASVVNLGGGSTSVGQDAFTAGTQIRIARNPSTVIVQGPAPGEQTTFRPAQSFGSDTMVGPGAQFDLDIVDAGYFNISLGRHNFLGDHAFIGFRVSLEDGLPHYGWIELDYRVSPVAVGPPPLSTRLMYQPVRWAYETLPNMPITIIPGPGSGAFLAFAGAFGARRRRSP